MKARKKPIIVDVVRAIKHHWIQTAHGPVQATPGDYILTDPRDGDTWPIKPDFFAQNYEVIEP